MNWKVKRFNYLKVVMSSREEIMLQIQIYYQISTKKYKVECVKNSYGTLCSENKLNK